MELGNKFQFLISKLKKHLNLFIVNIFTKKRNHIDKKSAKASNCLKNITLLISSSCVYVLTLTEKKFVFKWICKVLKYLSNMNIKLLNQINVINISNHFHVISTFPSQCAISSTRLTSCQLAFSKFTENFSLMVMQFVKVKEIFKKNL